MLEIATAKVIKVIETLISDYGLEPSRIILVGWGGGSGALIPYLAGKLGLEHRIARNAPVISTIGVALAMVREMIERTIPNPGQEELRTRDLMVRELPLSELKARAGRSIGIDPTGAKLLAQAGRWFVFGAQVASGRFWNLFSRKQNPVRVLDKEGVVRLQKSEGAVHTTTYSKATSDLKMQLDAGTIYGDAGGQMPEPYLFCGERMIDLSGLHTKEQVLSLAEVELAGLPAETAVVILTCKRP